MLSCILSLHKHIELIELMIQIGGPTTWRTQSKKHDREKYSKGPIPQNNTIQHIYSNKKDQMDHFMYNTFEICPIRKLLIPSCFHFPSNHSPPSD